MPYNYFNTTTLNRAWSKLKMMRRYWAILIPSDKKTLPEPITKKQTVIITHRNCMFLLTGLRT